MNREDKLKFFVNELNDIQDKNLREFAEILISDAPDYFFTVAASSSGKYHPTFDLGNGGLVRHTRCVAFFARSVAESLDWNSHDTDLLIIAAIAHDIQKQGDGTTGYTVREHPILAKKYVMSRITRNADVISLEDGEKIANAVASHMGKWEAREPWLKGKDAYPMPKDEFEKALQIADYIASRKEILDFNFRETEAVEVPETPAPTSNVEPKDYVYPFGKNKGKTIEEGGKGYAEWIAKQDDYSNKEVQNMCRLYLESLNPGKKFVEDEPIAPNDVDDLPF